MKFHLILKGVIKVNNLERKFDSERDTKEIRRNKS